MRILVVEDEPLLAMMLEEYLAELGHELLGSAATAAQAFEFLDGDGPTPDLALLDFSLGQDANSLPVARRLRDLRVPFAYLTGHFSLDLENGDPEAPIVTKPFNLADLDAAIRSLQVTV